MHASVTTFEEKSTWFYIPAMPGFRVLQIHVMLREVSLNLLVWPHLVFSWIGGKEAIGKSWVAENNEIGWHRAS